MMKHVTDKIIMAAFVIAMALSVLTLPVKASGEGESGEEIKAEAKAAEKTADDHVVGGGYAASDQIPGVYYLPVLYDASNGLPTSEANCILASGDGYIWIGGCSGVIKYDGVSFERLPVSDGLTGGRALFEDTKGRIWVATNDSGVVVIDKNKRWRFTKADGLNSDSIRTFAADADGNVFIGSTAGVAYVDKDMVLHPVDDDRINKERIPRLVSGVDGTVYGHDGNGDVFSVSIFGITEYYTSGELGMEKITTILNDPDEPGKLYFGTAANYVYHGTFGQKASAMKKTDVNPASNIHWMHFACGRLWVSSTKVAGYVNEDDQFVAYESLPIKDSFEMMTSDRQGNMWFASSRYGVMKLVADNFLDITGAAGLESEVVNATCMRGTDLYAGTDNGLKIISQDYRIKHNQVTDYLGNTRIRCIMNDSAGNTWFSTFSGNQGLVCLDSAGNLKSYTTDNGLPGNEIRCTYETKDGRILVGTNNGVAVMKDGRVTETYGPENGLDNTVIITLCEGESGQIIAGTDGDGVYVLKNGALDRRIGAEDGLGSDVIVRIKKDDLRDLYWVITSSTVAYVKDGKVTRVTTIPYNNNVDVINAGEDELWFLSTQGIYAVDAMSAVNDEITVYKHYTRANGLTSVPVIHSYSGMDKGTLYVAGQTGVSVVKVEDLYDLSGRTEVGIRSIYYDGEEVLPDFSGTYNLPAGKGRVQINPAVFDYTINDPLVKVFVEGMDDDGITDFQSGLTPLEYTGMKYGDYKLHIQILDASGKAVEDEHVFNIVKTPGFMEVFSVRIMLILMAVAVIGIFIWRVSTNYILRKQYTAVQEARDEARRASLAKSRFMTNISHEIRTPINTIIGMDEMILREEPKGVPGEYYGHITDFAHNIKYASETLLALINDLFDISGIESGKMQLSEHEYDTAEMIHGSVSMIKGRAEEKKLHFEVEVDESLPVRLYGDWEKIGRIILNLLTNAVKYTDEGGCKLCIIVTDKSETGVSLRISVRDTGIGIKSEDMEKLFSAYERMDEAGGTDLQGSGLGLDISRQYANLLGGKLWCESVYGQGSEFLFTVRQKVVDETPIGEFTIDTSDLSAEKYKPKFIAPDADILIVDDNPSSLTVFKGLLKPTKIFVTTAGSGEECLKKIAENDFNLVLLDHMMPGMDGVQTLDRIRDDHPDLPVYALTSNAPTAGNEDFYISKGFNGYLLKPVDIMEVEQVIMNHLPESIMIKQ